MKCGRIENAFQRAFEQDDHRAVLQCRNAMKRFDESPPVALTNVLQSMQRFKKYTPEILREFKSFFKKYAGPSNTSAVNDLLEPLDKRFDLELMKKSVETQDMLVDTMFDAEVAEIKRAAFRAPTRLRAATVKLITNS